MSKTLGRIDLAVAVLLSAFGVYLVSGADHDNTKHAGAPAAVLVLFMTLPVAWRRSAPVAVALILGAGAVLNWLIIGPMIRCGPALPALLLCAYALGRSPQRLPRRPAGVGLAALLLSATVQSLTDPQLDGAVMVAMGPLILGLYGVGLLVRSRVELAAELGRRNEELRHQRALRAELAVQADRARIAEGLDATLSSQIVEMAVTAATGQRAIDDHQTTATREAFTSIQHQGRETLNHMRQVVGTLLESEAPALAPQPSLSQLDGLVGRAGVVDVRLHVTGTPTVLPPGLEASAYRTLEHLLDAYGNAPAQHVDVDVDFATEALSLRVVGPAPPHVDRQAALASAQARVDVHRGSLQTSCPGGLWEASVTLPLQDGG